MALSGRRINIFFLIQNDISWFYQNIIFSKTSKWRTQMPKPPEATRHHKSIKLFIFLPLRADLLCTLHYETPCTYLLKLKCFFRFHHMIHWVQKRSRTFVTHDVCAWLSKKSFFTTTLSVTWGCWITFCLYFICRLTKE